MADYMERETAIKAIEKADCAVIADDAESCKTDYLREIIKSVPAADVAPVVHGRWSDAGFGELPKHAPYGWACSVCGGISFNNEYIYCPNCGAKMDGGDNTER
nr:MAG TPA: DNA-directed RNA polymerase [Caudoviricetes sp.]